MIALRELGGTGELVPEIGLGTWQYRGGVAPLERGMELGATLIDTAEIYGSEGVVGEAIRGQRHKVFLATKVSGDHLKYADILKAADASLKRLGVEVIDLYQLHWPSERVPIAETMQALEELVDAGKVRYIGVSNFSVAELTEAQACLARHRIVSNQIEYSLMYRSYEKDFPFYEREKISVIAYSPFARGDLFSPRGRGKDVLRAVSEGVGKTVAQVALAWCLARPPVIVIPKTDRVGRVDELVGASGFTLTAEQVGWLDDAFR